MHSSQLESSSGIDSEPISRCSPKTSFSRRSKSVEVPKAPARHARSISLISSITFKIASLSDAADCSFSSIPLISVTRTSASSNTELAAARALATAEGVMVSTRAFEASSSRATEDACASAGAI
ncbi:hypothetical protein D3C85_1472920 [compost metagenome]